MGRILAIDYGKKRIGLAITDPQQIMALPFKTIDAGNNIKESIQNIIKETPDGIEKIIIGNPLLFNGTASEMSKVVETLKLELEKTLTDVPVILFDERLTSTQAERFLKEHKVNRKKRVGKVDPIAAYIILNGYLAATT
jgi:putative holliday junction resolvase